MNRYISRRPSRRTAETIAGGTAGTMFPIPTKLAGEMHRSAGVLAGLIRRSASELYASALLLILALLTVACGGTSVTELTGPGAIGGAGSDRCETVLGGTIPTVDPGGGRLELAVVAARECAWTASADASWAQVAPSAGQGETVVVVTVAANPQANPRSTAIVLNGQRTMLAQAPAPCRYSLSGNSTHQPAAGGTTSVQVTATSGCSWTASSPVDWVSGARRAARTASPLPCRSMPTLARPAARN